MSAKNKNGHFNLMIIVGSLAVLVVGAPLILWSKGYFKSDNEGSRLYDSPFAKMADEHQSAWEAAAPTDFADRVRNRIKTDIDTYQDKRFSKIREEFQDHEKRYKKGKLNNQEYQKALVALDNQLREIENEIDPEKSKRDDGDISSLE